MRVIASVAIGRDLDQYGRIRRYRWPARKPARYPVRVPAVEVPESVQAVDLALRGNGCHGDNVDGSRCRELLY
ncbi:MAG: hypothetical protein OXC19_24280, partial [Bryobacterales bacterium]|nr:hypothetical protein [Bryobacterales bacterium]